MMPVGFLLAGVWHPEGDPGLAIWIVPPGALLAIFGVVALAMSQYRERLFPQYVRYESRARYCSRY